MHLKGRKKIMHGGSTTNECEMKTGLPLNINMAGIINENLSKDLIDLQPSEALQGSSEGGKEWRQRDKEAGIKEVRWTD